MHLTVEKVNNNNRCALSTLPSISQRTYYKENRAADMEFTEINAPENSANVKVKVPKRVLHFSDGVLEEFSDDEDQTDQPKSEKQVDPRTLPWSDWFAFKAWAAATGTLSAVDYMGEFLATLFGITTPKYQFEIDEYNRIEEHKKELQEHTSGWTAPGTTNVTEQPAANPGTDQPSPV